MSLGRPSDEELDVWGGVLSADRIELFVAAGKLITDETFCKDALRPAAYDVEVARNGLITPDGREVPPATRAESHAGRAGEELTLESGDTAVFSTSEHFCMPDSVAGNVSIKNRYAARGLMLLSGMLIDPGFGATPTGKDVETGDTADYVCGRPLHLHVVNLGSNLITIRPGEDRIASVQFLPVCAPSQWDQQIVASGWKDQKRPSLGFLAQLKQLNSEHNELTRVVSNTDQMVRYVVLLGFILLGATILGVVLATTLAIVSR